MKLRLAAAAFFVVLVGTIVRVRGLAEESLWIDEVISLDQSRRPVADALRYAAFADLHPPGHVVMLRLWTSVAGEGDGALRWLSILAGLLALAGTVKLVAGPASAALIAGMILALHAGHIHYSQEVRAYAWLSAWVLLLLYSAEATARLPRRGSAAAGGLMLGVAAAAGLWLHHVAWLFLAGLALGLGVRHRRDRLRLRRIGAGLGIASALAAPWVPAFWHQLVGLPAGFSAHLHRPPDVEAFARVLGPWGGLESSWFVYAGAALLAATVISALLREGGASPPEPASFSPSSGAGEGPPGSRSFGRLVVGLVLGAGLLALPVPLLLPSTPLQGELMSGAMLPGVLLAMALTAGLALGPEIVGWASRRLLGEGRFGERGGDAGALLLGAALLGLLAVASGRMSVPRNLLPLVPLAMVCIGRRLAGQPGPVRTLLRVGVVALLLPLPFSAADQVDRVAPRPAYKEVLIAARIRGATGAVVFPRFDAPALRHAAEVEGLRHFSVRGAGEAPALRSTDAIVLTRGRCERAAHILPPNRPLRSLRHLRGLCLVPPPRPHFPGSVRSPGS